MRNLVASFVTAIDAEIALIEKEGRDQSYELLSGRRDDRAAGLLYVFLLADPLRMPEDAAGVLQADGKEYPALVASQEGNRIWILLESSDTPPPIFSSARLVLNQTDLLRRLKESMEALGQSADFGLGPKVFGLEPLVTAQGELSQRVSLALADSPTQQVLAQATGSDVTYVWGPPGTGKTFAIAALVASLSDSGETVLVTSHTHAAVEQALWALIRPADEDHEAGFMHENSLVEQGRILKVGTLKSQLLKHVHLDGYLEQLNKEREENVAALRRELERLTKGTVPLRHQLELWEAYAKARAVYENSLRRMEATGASYQESSETLKSGEERHRECGRLLHTTQSSFFIGRSGRVQRAQREYLAAQAGVNEATAILAKAHAGALRARAKAEELYELALQKEREVQALRSRNELESELSQIDTRRTVIQQEVDALIQSADEDARALVREAVAVFATLTKLYIDRNLLPDLTWDTVVIDEASMAMPPLVAYAVARARKRVVIVGDMYQLPPVVQSPLGTAGEILSKSVFDLCGITDEIDKGKKRPSVAMLTLQRRMHPEIADVARHLIEQYAPLTDYPPTSRDVPELEDALGTQAPLIVADVSSLRPWSGKMPGSLSRFNLLTAQVAVEIAALYARSLPEPPEDSPAPIGIVTPYAAQRRYLSRLVQTLGLERWVTAGTVHTFQGNECDVVIFDSVLGEPHWTARLTDPNQFRHVRRDLNVAVTRAKHQFIFVGDSAWLGHHAKPASGYGMLWGYLKSNAVVFSAEEIVGDGLRSRLVAASREINGWTSANAKAELLTEAEFYPAFGSDLTKAASRVVLYTPFIGKTRWPTVEPQIAALRERGVKVFVLHKPLSDPEWKSGDPAFGKEVFDRLARLGVVLIPMSGVHAKTIVIDGEIVYEGSLNWASQTRSYEHIWRFEDKAMAVLIERMLQLKPLTAAFEEAETASTCPNCHGPLRVINQAQQKQSGDVHPVKLGCNNYYEDKSACRGYLRRVDGRAPFLKPPTCPLGTRMKVHFSANHRPWDWRCGHKGCRTIRWARGDCER